MKKILFAFVCLSLSGAVALAQRNANGTNGITIPDVYVQAGNSFVITVPNLTRVAVGNPDVVTANVVSPTEVMIQGNPGPESVRGQAEMIRNVFGSIGGIAGTDPNTGQPFAIDPSRAAAATPPSAAPYLATSEVFVWSGQKRYVYRVVVVEVSAAALPYGVSRMVVEPNKIIFYGLDINRTTTEADLQRFRALGLKYELRLSPITVTDVSAAFVELDTRTVERAVSEGRVIPGMTLREVERARGLLPERLTTELRDRVVIDVYRFPDYDVLVYEGRVIEVDRRGIPERTSDQQALVEAAIDSGIVVPGMTVSEMIRTLGVPPSAPTVVPTPAGRIRTIYVYPSARVIFEGFADQEPVVIDVQSLTSPIPPVDRRPPVELGQAALGGDTLIARAFEMKFFTGADLARVLEDIEEDDPSILNYRIIYSGTEGKFLIYADPSTMHFIENLLRVFDAPTADEGITIEVTEFTIPAQIVLSGIGEPARQIGFLMAKFGPSISAERRAAIADELRQAIALVPVIPRGIPLALTSEGNFITVTGAPEQVRLVENLLREMIPRTAGIDVEAAIRQGVIMTGMTRAQVEAALGRRLGNITPLRTFQDGALTVSYDLGDRLLRFREDILVEEISYPAADQRRNAIEEKRLIPYLARADVELIIGEQAMRVTERPDGMTEVRYDFGDAVYYNGRLVQFNNLSGSEAARRGIAVAVPFEAGREFDLLTTEERVAIMRGGGVMTGMTERDVARVLGESPFSIRPGATPNEKVYVYTDHEITFRDGIAVNIRQTGEGAPRIIAVKSRAAQDIAALIRTAYSDVDGLEVTVDEPSNRLVIRAPAERFAEIERFAKTMDQQTVQQVLIEAKFVEVNRAAVKNLGIDWGLSTVADNGVNRPFAGVGGAPATVTSGRPITLAGGGLLLGMLGGNGFNLSGLNYTNVDVVIDALETSRDADVLSSPRILTLNNQNAVLRNRDILYNVTTTTTTAGNPPVTTTGTTFTEVPVGITLDVTPTIGQDGIITLDLNAEVSRLANRRTDLGPGIVVNEIATRTSQSRVMVRSGTPLVIGGLSSRSENRNDAKVPGLGNLPLVGWIFGSQKDRSRTDVDLLIFLTARIVPADGTLSPVDAMTERPRPHIPNPPPRTTLDTAVISAR